MERVPARRRHAHLLRHGAPGGRRLHARQGRAAPRDRAGLRRRARRSPRAPRPGDPGAGRSCRRWCAATTRRSAREMSELRPRRARRRCSICTATSTATATAGATCPTARRWCSSTRASPTSSRASSSELWKKAMNAIGVRIEFKLAKWPEQLKAARAGKLMMWGVGWTAATPDGSVLPRSAATARTRARPTTRASTCPSSMRCTSSSVVLPDGPERDALIARGEAADVGLHAVQAHRATASAIDLMQPWVSGYRRHPFLRDFWRYVDIDERRDAEVNNRPRSGPAFERHGGPQAGSAVLRSSARRSAAASPQRWRSRSRAAAGARRCCATRSRSPRPASTRRRSATSTRASSPRISSRRPTTTTISRRPYKVQPRHRAPAMPEVSDDFRTWTVRMKPGILLQPTTRRSRASQRELVAQDYVYSLQALLRSGEQEPELVVLEERGHHRPAASCARRR